MARRADSAVVTIAGPADIKTAGKLHRQLLNALQKHAAVEIDVAKTTEFDLTFVQLMESARRFAAAEGKSLCLSAPATGSLAEILARGGFLKEASNAEFWLRKVGER